jgi:hypothetical protein
MGDPLTTNPHRKTPRLASHETALSRAVLWRDNSPSSGPRTGETSMDSKQATGFGAAEIGALAHLYRGKMY